MSADDEAAAAAEADDGKATTEENGDADGVGSSERSTPSKEGEASSSSSSSSSACAGAASPSPATRARSIGGRCRSFYSKNSFLVLVVLAILLAYAYPPLGAHYLVPDVTSDWIAVIIIFVLSGMGIRTEELGKALQRLRFNAYVQAYNFGVVSGLVYGISRLMLGFGALSVGLADGMVVCSCLPVTVSMVMVLTKSANGDEAAAVFHAAFGNMIGIFLSPALIAMYLGVSGDVDLARVTTKLVLRVLVPLMAGQFLRCFVPPARNYVDGRSAFFKKVQEWLLVFIVYTVFCETFETGMDATVGQIFLMIALQGGILVLVMALAWSSLGVLFPGQPRLRAMGLFGCTHKTVAMGIPLINSMYSDIAPASVGLYTLPLLIWHPMQLLLGTAIAPRVAEWVDAREAASTTRGQERELVPLEADDSPPI